MKVLWADFEVYLFGIGRRFDPASADENKITHARELNFTEQSSADYRGGGGKDPKERKYRRKKIQVWSRLGVTSEYEEGTMSNNIRKK